MGISPFNAKILGLSFYQKTPHARLFAFEQQMIYGVMQFLNLFTPIQFIDQAIPPSRMMLGPTLSETEAAHELSQAARRFGTEYVLHGTMDYDLDGSDRMKGIHITVQLFDVKHQRYALQLQYYFDDFVQTDDEDGVAPDWHGLMALIRWFVISLITAVAAESAGLFWSKLPTLSLAKSYPSYCQLAAAHYTGGDQAQSKKLAILLSATAEEEPSFLVFLELGMVQKQLHNHTQAIVALEHAYEQMQQTIPHQRARVASEIGVCYALTSRSSRAIHWWKLAIQDDPSFVTPYINLAHEAENQNNNAEAEFYFSRATTIAPNDIRIYYNLARLYSKQEEWDKAITTYHHQLLLEPDNAWTYSNLADCYLQRGQIEDAKLCLQKTLSLDSEGEAGRLADYILSSLAAVEVA